MRRIYLIRHGRPDFPENARWCLGSTDLELGIQGHLQACLLGEVMKEISLEVVFCSPLSRSIQTAEYLSDSPVILSGLKEQYFGVWDGLSFEEIRQKWPELYERRGNDRALLPPGSEKTETAERRFLKAIESALAMSRGDIAIVAHQSVIQMFLCHVFGESLKERHKYRMDYASVTVLEYERSCEAVCVHEEVAIADSECPLYCSCEAVCVHEEVAIADSECPLYGKIQLCAINQMPRPPLSEAVCRRLLQAAKVPEHIVRHCELVAAEAKRLCRELARAGYLLDEESVVCSGWLHDLARMQPDHEKTGAGWIRRLGYEKIADIIGQHHNLSNPQILDEAAVVCMADCCACEDRKVSIEERFKRSSSKCRNDEAQRAHQRRYENALWLKAQINQICRKDVVL